MKASLLPVESIAGLVSVRIYFYGDSGELDARPPITAIVPDEGGSILVGQNACRKAMDGLNDDEAETRAALQAWIDKWDSIPGRGSSV